MREKTVVKVEKVGHVGWGAARGPLTLAINEGCEVSQDLARIPQGPEESKRTLGASLTHVKGLP